jgi:hypothetical protein
MNGVPDLLMVWAIFSLSNFSVLPLVRLTISFCGLALFALTSALPLRALPVLPLALALALAPALALTFARRLGAALLDFLRSAIIVRAQPC